MKSIEELIKITEKGRNLILSAERFLWQNAETGYKEWKSTKYLEDEFEHLGYTLIRAENIPGFYTDFDTGIPGPKILVFGELDSLKCTEHPDANPETGAVHACGHNAQAAALLGLAAALKENSLEGVTGSVRLCAVPAEELIETGFREELRKQGVIKYFGGKVEFMHRGYFEGVDIALMVHTTGGKPNSFYICKGCNGCVVKNIAFKGKASHAGGAPHSGINALYAANLGMQAINALRETFRDNDHIRVHPIITKGGIAVNAIPSDVTMESYVRGADLNVIKDVNKRVNRALAGSAAALGAGVILSDRPGYTPLINDINLKELAVKAMKAVVPEENVSSDEGWDTGCTDMGDISAVIPAIHPYVSGASGTGHGMDYYISDPESACVTSAKFQLVLLFMLLSNDAYEAKKIIENKNLRFSSKEEYFKEIDEFYTDKNAVVYKDDGTILLNF
ncbi:MAG: amidohydrolase [Clostridia bacterium]|nr:amidohydrolase [Clostridia bacterium]